jgi:hypothetical protein
MPQLRPQEKFAPRVQVLSPAGDHVYSAHREEAERLVRDGIAVRQGTGRRILQIALVESVANRATGPCSTPSRRDYMGQSYTLRTGNMHRFKDIDPRDEPLFRMAVTDCLKADMEKR